MQIAVLGSSSAGNCTVVWDGKSSLVVDCGFSPRFIEEGMRALDHGVPPPAGVLITHVHSDHVNPLALAHYLERRIPVILPKKVARVLERRFDFFKRARESNLVRDTTGRGVEVGRFEIRSFPVPHDSPGGCFGYSIVTGSGAARRRVTIATDLGYPQEGLEAMFAGADAFVIESNHDPAMLENSDRPQWLKQRIREIGHLSNDQCAEFVARVLEVSDHPVRTVVLAHISQECNTNRLALECTRSMLARRGLSQTRVIPTHQSMASEIVSL